MEHGPDAGASRPERRTGPGSSFRGALSRGALGRGWGCAERLCGAHAHVRTCRSGRCREARARRGLCPGLRALL